MISYRLETTLTKGHPDYFEPFTSAGYVLPREGGIVSVDTGENFRNYEVQSIIHFACKMIPQLPTVRVR